MGSSYRRQPRHPNITYFALNGYGSIAGHPILENERSSALNFGPTPNWKSAGFGLPNISRNGLVIDPKIFSSPLCRDRHRRLCFDQRSHQLAPIRD